MRPLRRAALALAALLSSACTLVLPLAPAPAVDAEVAPSASDAALVDAALVDAALVDAREVDAGVGARATPEPAPRATSRVFVSVELDLRAEVAPAPFDVSAPSTTSNFAIGTEVDDAIGARHWVEVYFRAEGDGVFTWHAILPTVETTTWGPGDWVEVDTGTLTCDPSGHVHETVSPSAWNFYGAPVGQTIEWSLTRAPLPDGRWPVSRCTGRGWAVRALAQDGRPLPE